MEARRSDLLPVPSFHLVFTLPHELNALILWNENNQQVLLDLLFAAAATLSTFGRAHLGGKVGFLLVLHTWDQRLRAHCGSAGRSPGWCTRSRRLPELEEWNTS